MKTIKTILLLCVIGYLSSCIDDNQPSIELAVPTLPSTPYKYANLQLPQGVGQAGSFDDFSIDEFGNITFPGRFMKIDDNTATLGRVLFYDKNLSLNNAVACASCHHQDKAFADGLASSPGFEGRMTDRNSMAIVNPISQNNLFWDSRSFSIADLSLKPVQNHIEMGMEDLTYLTKKLSKLDYYPELFEKAFDDKEITEERISKAISSFVGSITTSHSKFDTGLSQDFSNFTELEKMGMQIFHSERAKCGSCHSGNNFAADDSPGGEYGSETFGEQDPNNPKGTTNIGLDIVYADNGKESGKFKIPSLRNIALTGPYMHDGRFETLEDVIDHYSRGIKPHKDLDKKLKNQNGSPIRMNFDELEKTALIAFLNTLTDHEMIKDPKYSDPFNQ